MKHNFYKIVFVSTVIVLLAVGCGKQPTSYNECASMGGKVTGFMPTQCEYQGQTFTGPSQEAMPDQIQTTSTPSPTSVQNGQQVQAPTGITVQQSVAGATKQIVAVPGMNALELLKIYHKVLTKNYSGVGEFVTSIDGVAADSKHFWEFFVNGKSSNVGAGSYTLKNGDSVEWKMSAIK